MKHFPLLLLPFESLFFYYFCFYFYYFYFYFYYFYFYFYYFYFIFTISIFIFTIFIFTISIFIFTISIFIFTISIFIFTISIFIFTISIFTFTIYFYFTSGVRLAQELLQSMESIVSAELSEIRRCTAELSSRYRLKSRLRDDMLPSSTQLKQMSQFYVMPSPTPHPAPDTERCRSEPPFGGDGLYRAQSCPGLPRPLQTEKVPELRCSSHMPRLRSERTPPTREKLLNRCWEGLTCTEILYPNWKFIMYHA